MNEPVDSESFDLASALAFARELASLAEPEILPRFRACSVKQKADGSEVTEADISAERVMRRAIEARYPQHAILGEEDGVSGPESAECQWLLDPIDGTSWFVAGVPVFGTLIALLQEGKPVVGVIHFPALGETVAAARGLGCWFRSDAGTESRIQVRKPTPLAEASVSASGVHGSDLRDDDPNYNLTAVIRAAGRFRFLTDCYQHALVCRGVIDAGIDTIMNPWDNAAVIPCVEEAGGVVSRVTGERFESDLGGSLLSSSSEDLHGELVAALNHG